VRPNSIRWRERINVKRHKLVLPLFLLLVLTGQTVVSGQDAQPTPAKETVKEEELVHYGDILDVDVVGGFEFDWRGTLTPEGYLDGLDGFNEPVYGLCRSESQITADVVKAFSKILRDPQIIVRIIDRSNRAVVRVEGGIKTPTRFRIMRPVDLKELIVLAGGMTDQASGEISIFRQKNLSCRSENVPVVMVGDVARSQDNGSQTINIKISDLLSGKDAANPQILSGDLITVNQALPIYVIGAVNSPRPIYARSQTTVSHAIATAGGLVKGAGEDTISIYRREGGDTKIVSVDLGKIRRGESEDVILRPFDIIDVAAKGGGKRKYPPAVGSSENRNRTITELPLRVVD